LDAVGADATAALVETKRIQVGVFHDQPQSNGLAGQFAHIGPSLLNRLTLQRVAENFGTIA
jgi:hypothetical protein